MTRGKAGPSGTAPYDSGASALDESIPMEPMDNKPEMRHIASLRAANPRKVDKWRGSRIGPENRPDAERCLSPTIIMSKPETDQTIRSSDDGRANRDAVDVGEESDDDEMPALTPVEDTDKGQRVSDINQTRQLPTMS